MAEATGITVVKRFTYRGVNEEYSNTYWFTQAPPASSAGWRTLFDALVAQEKTLYPSIVSVVRGYAYNDDTGHKTGDSPPASPAVWSVDLTVSPEVVVPGTYTLATGDAAPGDAAVWVRWKTSRLNENGKAIYLRKYFHPAPQDSSTADNVRAAWITAGNAFGLKMRDGTFQDTRTVTAPGHTDVLTSHGVSPYITTRTLKRRGKRNPTSP